VINPAIGRYRRPGDGSDVGDVDTALQAAAAAFPAWEGHPAAARAAICRVADLFEQHMPS
jgi:delta 1-pyrroline-5-carboxylate dehydrogenase